MFFFGLENSIFVFLPMRQSQWYSPIGAQDIGWIKNDKKGFTLYNKRELVALRSVLFYSTNCLKIGHLISIKLF